ncbi:MAG: hypothetical protein LBG62_05435 [Candidatus Methanoplasma sp.]|jgi:hypothetical protein|nr:hypothetical protein [Candidatus Methanoplasma sp.]
MQKALSVPWDDWAPIEEKGLKGMHLSICSLEDVMIFKSVTERDGDREDCARLIASRRIDWNAVLDEIKCQVDAGESAWITWMASFFDELAENGAPIPHKVLAEVDRMSDEFFGRYEKTRSRQ